MGDYTLTTIISNFADEFTHLTAIGLYFPQIPLLRDVVYSAVINDSNLFA